MTPLTSMPVYIGLYFSLVLALTCNAFLDIQYGAFATEITIWSVVLGATLWVGWQQHGQPSEGGRRLQKILLVVGALSFVLVFMRTWGMPRAGVYWLAAMQVANNCTTTTRRQLYYGATVSVVLVLFASSHVRADWSMLFYVIPFVIAIVFTLVADQISQRASEIRAMSIGRQMFGGQWLAIASASAVILAVSALLYAVVPQTDWGRLHWGYGLPAAKPSDGTASRGAAAASGAEASSAGSASRRSDWPTPGQMREAAKRRGMPAWQAKLINTLADVSESFSAAMAQVEKRIKTVVDAIKRHNSLSFLRLLLALLALALLGASIFFLREMRPVAWLWTRLDYLRHVILGGNTDGHQEVAKVYRAITRLFAYHGEPRMPTENTREYLAQLSRFRPDLQTELGCVTEIFERTRYGAATPNDHDVALVRGAYRKLFRQLAN